MEKSIKPSVVMSQVHLADPSTVINAVLALRSQVTGSVSTDILSRIQNLKGVLDSKTLASARNGGDWRRGSGSTGQAQGQGQGQGQGQWRPSNQRQYSRPMTASPTLVTPLAQSQSQGQGQNSKVPKQTSAVTSTAKQAPIYTGPPTGRYQSRFKNQSEPLEEKILNRIIRLKLNKFSPNTYIEIREFLFQILGQESVSLEEGGTINASEGQVVEFVRDFMTMVFRKAAAEEIYCPLYAKLLSEIGSKHSVIFDEMARLYSNYIEIFEEPDVNVASAESMAAFEKKNLEKKYRQGYSQFIAELTALEILSLDSLSLTYNKLITLTESHSKIVDQKPLVEEYVDCILRMSRVLKSKQSAFFITTKTRLWSENKDIITGLISLRNTNYLSLSPKSRFLLMDIQDILSS